MHEFKREVEMHGGMFHFVGAFFGDSPADSGHCSLALFTPVVISTQSCCQCMQPRPQHLSAHVCSVIMQHAEAKIQTYVVGFAGFCTRLRVF